MTLSSVVLGLLSGCVVNVGGGEPSWSFEQPRELVVTLGSGDIQVRSTPSTEMQVRYDGGGLGDSANPDVWQDRDGTVIVDADEGIFGGGSVEVELPAGVDVDLVVDRGAIEVQLDAPTNIYACVGAGSVSIGVPPGPYELDVAVGAGAISSEVYHQRGAPYRIEVCTGAGDVQIFGR